MKTPLLIAVIFVLLAIILGQSFFLGRRPPVSEAASTGNAPASGGHAAFPMNPQNRTEIALEGHRTESAGSSSLPLARANATTQSANSFPQTAGVPVSADYSIGADSSASTPITTPKANTQSAGGQPGATFAAPVQANGANDAGVSEQELAVPLGARVPAALMDDSPNLTPQQAQALDTISSDFVDQASPQGNASTPKPSPAPNSPKTNDNWNSALTAADEQYRALFGDAAYNARGMQSAVEGLHEQQGVPEPIP